MNVQPIGKYTKDTRPSPHRPLLNAQIRELLILAADLNSIFLSNNLSTCVRTCVRAPLLLQHLSDTYTPL